MTGLGVVLFIVALLASVMLHELGHLATAKHYGMKATRYFVGFGPTLWSTQRGETEYGIKAIPAGGFVKIIGMTDLEEIEPGDEDKVFYKYPARQRAVVLAAGSTMHFVIALVLVFIAVAAVGVRTDRISTTIAEVSACLPKDAAVGCTPDDPPSPAKAAGIQPGDRIVSFDDKPIVDWSHDFTAAIRSHAPGPTTIVVRRDGRLLTLHPVLRESERLDQDGQVEKVVQIGLLPDAELRRYGGTAAFTETGHIMWRMVTGTAEALKSLPGAIPKTIDAAIHGTERDERSLVSAVGIGQIAGKQAARGEYADFLGLIAGLNLFLGIANLLPLLPLDGGHIAVLGYEQGRSRIARLRRKPDPGRVDIRKLLPAAYVFVILMSALMLIGLYADVTNPIVFP